MIYICYAVLQKMNLEACLEQVFASVADAEFGCDSAYIYVGRVEKLEDLAERLAGAVHALESGILLDGFIASLDENEFFHCVWLQVIMDFSASCAFHAVCRPCSAVFLERRVVGGMAVAYEKDREGVKYLVVLSALALGL